MVKKALLIGCNYPGCENSLRGCCNDANNLAAMLQECGYSEVRLLTDAHDNCPSTTGKDKDKGKDKGKDKKKDEGKDKGKDKNKEKDKGKDKQKDKDKNPSKDLSTLPTRQNIINGLTWLTDGTKPGDHVFFSFSGHGGQVKDLDGDEEDGLDETILPCDFRQSGQIVDDELHKRLVKSLPNGVHSFAIMDCCHSGTGLDLPYIILGKGEKPNKSEKEKIKEEKKKQKEEKKNKKMGKGKDKDKKDKKEGKDKDKGKDKGKDKEKKDKGKDKEKEKEKKDGKSHATCVLISGCQDNQTSADVTTRGGSSGGALSIAFCQVMRQEKFNISYLDLLYKVRDIMKAGNLTQIPQLSYNNAELDFDEIIPF